jgi:hypothetical protein
LATATLKFSPKQPRPVMDSRTPLAGVISIGCGHGAVQFNVVMAGCTGCTQSYSCAHCCHSTTAPRHSSHCVQHWSTCTHSSNPSGKPAFYRQCHCCSVQAAIQSTHSSN